MPIAGAETGATLLAQADEFNLAGKFQEAAAIYDELLTQNHDSPDLLATIGTLCLRMQRNGLAITLLHRAIDIKPKSEFFSNLAIAYKYSGQYDKAMLYFKKATEKDATAETFATYSAMFINTGTPEIAVQQANKALEMNPNHSMAHWNRAMAMLELGQWEHAWDEHEWGFEAKMRIRRNLANKPYWDGTPGKTVAVYGEQGLGDEIMFASMLPDLMAQNKVILDCHPRLKTLFEKSFPGLTCYGTRDKNMAPWTENHDIDYTVSLGSLGRWFRRSREAFPGTAYLKADPARKEGKFRVGISWTGGLKQGRVRTRTVPLPWWTSILNNDAEFISLQYTDCKPDIEIMKAQGYPIKQYDAIQANDYYETARLVASCDLIISCCTSVIHLAGALGVPCWVMVPNKPAWRYGVSGGMPWYRSVRLYRQPKGDVDAWRPVIEQVGFDLSERLKQRVQVAA